MQTCPNCGEENPERFRLCGYCGTLLTAEAAAPARRPALPALPAQEVRKTVTIVFSDLKGSTNLGEALDSESLREVMTRYFDAMRDELVRHGGTIEKYIGDAVMAVFGLPVLHEDDALRAVRAAAGMQRALATLNDELERHYGVRLTNRTGVNTGEVVAGDVTTGQRLVTGDPVNTAARLEQAAPANEILIGDLTYRLVRRAVEVEEVEPLELKGKAERVPAYRLVSVRADAAEGWARREDAPIVGRDAELDELVGRFEEARGVTAARLVTIVGEAGVGKTRLTRAFVEGVGTTARVFAGRCLPYGEGITFWPFVELTRAAAGILADDPPEVARAKVLALAGDRDVAARVASICGLTPAQFPLPDLYWGARKLLEGLAAREPVVAVFDDIHWAEPAFLDFIEHVVDAAEAPILLLCTARHELLEKRPEWSDGIASSRLVLDRLSDEVAGQIVANLLGDAGLPATVLSRIVTAAEGNPLFVEQMLSMLIDAGTIRIEAGRWVSSGDSGAISVPPTIQALLAARLDQLGREERAVIEPASVIGLEFVEPAVAELAPEAVRAAVPTHLGALTRRQLIRPDPERAAESLYRFRHVLVRQAAYGGLLKRTRATYHERFVVWADRVNAERGRTTEFEEILGYHLEQTHRYLSELGPLDEHGIAVGADAAGRLASAGRRAFTRGDMHAASNLFRRATGLLVEHDPNRLALLPDLGEALMELGEFGEAATVLDGAVRAADEIFDDRLRAYAALIRLMVAHHAGEGISVGEVQAEAQRAVEVFERLDDHAGLARASRLLFGIHDTACRYGDAAIAAERVIEEARLAGDLRLQSRGAAGYAIAATYGPLPAAEGIARCERLIAGLAGDRRTEGLISSMLAQLVAMTGDVARARELYRHGRSLLEDLGVRLLAASSSIDSWRVELLAGDLEAAERELRRDYIALTAMGERYLLSSIAGYLGRVVHIRGDATEALRLSETAESVAAPDDIVAQAVWRSVRSLALARTGAPAAAEELSRVAVAVIASADTPAYRADVLVDRAEVLRHAGRADDAAAILREARGLYAAKGDLVSVERVGRLLAGELAV